MAVTGSVMLERPRIAFAARNAMPVIGFLDAAASTADELAAFYDGLKVEGYIRNQTIEVVYHSAAGDYGRLPVLAADLVNRQVAAIAAVGAPAALAAKAVTTAIPVVFVIGRNPVEIGLVPGLDLPGGNMTGVTALASGRERKRLELLHQLIPAAAEIALLVNPANASADTQVGDATAASRTIGVRLRPIRATAAGAFDAAFDLIGRVATGRSGHRRRRAVREPGRRSRLFGAPTPYPGNLSGAFFRSGRRSYGLRQQSDRDVSPSRRLYRVGSKGREPLRACRFINRQRPSSLSVREPRHRSVSSSQPPY